MKTKKYLFLCFVFMFFLFPITSNAFSKENISQEKEVLIEQRNNLKNKLTSSNLELDSINKDIKIYGENYTPNNSYSQLISTTNIITSTKTYGVNTCSIIENSNKVENDLTLKDLLEQEQEYNDTISNEIKELNKEIKKYKRLESITFDSLDVTKVSNMTVEEIQYVLRGTNLEPLAQDFYDAEQEYEVNALFIISIAAIESGWGTSHRAVYDNNLTGFGVYSDSSTGINSDTKRGNILLTAKTLHNNYLTEGGSCYHGKSVYGVSRSYCTSETWTDKVSSVGNNLYNDCINLYLND